jgi:hypothetical protein
MRIKSSRLIDASQRVLFQLLLSTDRWEWVEILVAVGLTQRWRAASVELQRLSVVVARVIVVVTATAAIAIGCWGGIEGSPDARHVGWTALNWVDEKMGSLNKVATQVNKL